VLDQALLLQASEGVEDKGFSAADLLPEVAGWTCHSGPRQAGQQGCFQIVGRRLESGTVLREHGGDLGSRILIDSRNAYEGVEDEKTRPKPIEGDLEASDVLPGLEAQFVDIEQVPTPSWRYKPGRTARAVVSKHSHPAPGGHGDGAI